MAAEVFNGTVDVGDTITYSVRSGSSHDVRIATVKEVIPYDSWKWDREISKRVECTAYRLKVEVTASSDNYALGKTVTLAVLERIVKL